jgi:hypothetical protein
VNKQLHETMVILAADKKKAAFLGSLLFVAIGLWVRAALVTGPHEAQGAGNTMSAGSASPDRADEPSKKEDEVFAQRVIVRVPTVKPLTRDLFALSDGLLALSAQTDQAQPDDPKSSLRIDDKSNQSRPESAAAREKRIHQEAAQLSLRSTMTGSNPVAVIAQDSGKLAGVVVRLGEEIAGFMLVQVRAREVEIEKEGVRVALTRDPS